jgi:hypothetical protein
MAYRARLQSTYESVQDIALSAERRLDEAEQLLYKGRHHTSIYLAGLAAEMFLKSALAYLRGAAPANPIDAYLEPVRRAYARRGRLSRDFESGHGLWFWSQVLIQERQARGLPMPRRFHRNLLANCAMLYADWFVAMRYRPGYASQHEALNFLATVEWFKSNHVALIT